MESKQKLSLTACRHDWRYDRTKCSSFLILQELMLHSPRQRHQVLCSLSFTLYGSPDSHQPSHGIIYDIQTRIAQLEEEKRRISCKTVKVRKRNHTRQTETAKILESTGLKLGPRSAMPPSTQQLKKSLEMLEAIKQNKMRELQEIMLSDQNSLSDELESDVLYFYEEYVRMKNEVAAAQEYESQIKQDYQTAIDILDNIENQKAEILEMQQESSMLNNNFSDSFGSSFIDLNAIKSNPQLLLEAEQQVERTNSELETTLAAELMSATKAEEIERDRSKQLMLATNSAIERLKAAISILENENS